MDCVEVGLPNSKHVESVWRWHSGQCPASLHSVDPGARCFVRLLRTPQCLLPKKFPCVQPGIPWPQGDIELWSREGRCCHSSMGGGRYELPCCGREGCGHRGVEQHSPQSGPVPVRWRQNATTPAMRLTYRVKLDKSCSVFS